MDSAQYAADGNLRLTYTTWVMALHASGVRSSTQEVAALCDAVISGSATAEQLLEALCAGFDTDASPVSVIRAARTHFGERLQTDLGQGNRVDRLSRVRGYQFGRQLPWLARIWERDLDGVVAPSWLLIEQVTDQVRTMDANPWNDIDEERLIALADFQVLWELDDCTSLSIQ